METLKINGDILNLETHLTAYGVAYVLEGSRVSWDHGNVSVLFNGTRDDAGKLLSQEVFGALNSDTGWFTDGAQPSGSKSYSSNVSPTVSPFFGAGSSAPSKESLEGVYRKRDALFDKLSVSNMEVASSAGKPMYWNGELTARGGSQLLTHVWNAGNDLLVTNFLTPVSELKALSMSEDDVLDVLAHGTTQTYFETEWSAVPSNGLASLFALMGLWALPTVARGGDRSVTAACAPRPRKYAKPSPWADRVPITVELPTFATPVSLAKIRSVVSSSNWLDDTPHARAWTREQGVDSRIIFTPAVLDKSQHHAERVGFGERVSVS